MAPATRVQHTTPTMTTSIITPRRGALGSLLLSGAVALAAAPTAAAQKADVVYRLNPRTGKTQAIQGSVTRDGLDKIEITLRDGDSKGYGSLEVIQVVWGDVPTEFEDGKKFARRADWGNAVKSYQSAADSSNARGPVKAAARMASVQSLISWGATQPARFADAVAEADRFLAEFAENRHLPTVRALKARAAWLSGDAEAARDGYRALHDAGKGGTDGYPTLMVAEAALSAGHAATAAKDTGTARELFTAAESAFREIAAGDTADATRAAAGAEEASLGESYSRIAREDFAGARGALERAVDKMETPAGRAAARLALGQCLVGLGENQAAIKELGWVSGLDHSNADRRAMALLALAQAELGLGDKGRTAAKAALDRVVASYGATPAAATARATLATF